MTRKEHERLQAHFNTLENHREKADAAFKRLQELNKTEGTGTRWCSAKLNAIDLLKCGKDYMYVYDTYVQEQAKCDALTDLGRELAELRFWK